MSQYAFSVEEKPYSENVMDRHMLRYSDDERNLSFNGLFNRLCCLVPRYIDSRCIRFRFFLGLFQ